MVNLMDLKLIRKIIVCKFVQNSNNMNTKKSMWMYKTSNGYEITSFFKGIYASCIKHIEQKQTKGIERGKQLQEIRDPREYHKY